MSSYKVPQDVEAEDKLLGPFSFKQFIYLLIATGFGALTVFLFGFIPPLIILTIPVALFFLVLSLPLRKEQPMEVYLGALINFLLRPRQRIWESDGIDNIIEFTNIIEEKDEISLKTLSAEQAIERFTFLSNVVDTGGWSVRGVNNSALQDSVLNEVENITDIHEDVSVINNFDRMLSERSDRQHDKLTNQIPQQNQNYTNLRPYEYSPVSQQNQPFNPYENNPAMSTNFDARAYQGNNYVNSLPNQNPYPTNFSQVIPVTPDPYYQTTPQSIDIADIPLRSQQQNNTPSLNESMLTPPNPDIIKLANNSDLSIESIANEAKRIRDNHSKRDILGGQDQVEIRFR